MPDSTPNKQIPNEVAAPPSIDAAQGSIVVAAPVADVYRRWLDFEEYPKFITAIHRVRKLDQNHFAASLTLNGEQHEAMLEIMLRVPERRLAWRTLSHRHGSHHLAAGVVCFERRPGQSTCITLKLTSSFGGALSDRVQAYLQNFKRLAEAGRPS